MNRLTSESMPRQALAILLTALVSLALACAGVSTPGTRRTPATSVKPATTPVTPRPTSSGHAILDSIESDVGHQPAGKAEQLVSPGARREVGDGDGVNVYRFGEALVSFQDYLQLRIFRNSSVVVEQLVNPEAPGVFGVSLIGTAFVSEQPSQPPKHVRATTPNGVVIETIGTVFLAHYSPGSQWTWVVVREGEVSVSTDDATVIVPAGFQTWVEPGSPPVPPVPATRLIVGNRFPLVDELTGGKIADGAVLANQQCSADAIVDLFESADPQSQTVDRLPLSGKFEAIWRTDDGDWVYGIHPATGVYGWVPAGRISCDYEVAQLPEEDEAEDFFAVTPTPTRTPTRTPTGTPASPTPAPFRVTRVQVVNVTPESSARCPTTFEFTGEIAAVGAGTVSYRWEFWDGSTSDVSVIRFGRAGTQQVRGSRAWEQEIDGAVRLRILRPSDLASNEVRFALRCPTIVGDFSGAWSVNLGKLELKQDGARVTGVLLVPTNESAVLEFAVEGTVEGAVLNGSARARQTSAAAEVVAGPIPLQLQTIRDTLDGGLQTGPRTRLRLCGARPGSPFAADCSFAGAWMTSLPRRDACAMELTRVDDTVSGTSCIGALGGTVSFVAGQEVLQGFVGDNRRTPFTFFLSQTGRQFQGNAAGEQAWCGWRNGAARPEECFKSLDGGATEPAPRGPDLVVTDLEITGRARVNEDGMVSVPIRAVVRNQGNQEAGPFKVAASYSYQRRSFTVAFTVPGQADRWYPTRSQPLAPKGSVTFEGTLTIRQRDADVTIQVEADSCAGEEFASQECRVAETNEDNNRSAPVKVALP